ncbi:hypothetical protein [Sporosarcina limicola]|uniref:Uncharacterized protein n=1 Tax=Sporosarcina limicola TaxID=34101 RepID=A0A927MGP5_9BACL|nr:hypothetical protein [Sporosarcina limicola]
MRTIFLQGGAPVESSFERTLYNHLCENERAVVRHNANEHPAWNKLHPDGLLLDTKPCTILEVFGMSENMEAYHIVRSIKVDHFSSLRPKYNFWYWDAFTKADFKKVPIKHNH